MSPPKEKSLPKPRLKSKTRQKPKPTIRVEHEEKVEPETPGYRRWLKYILAVLIALLLILKFMEEEAETPVHEAEPPQVVETVPGGTGVETQNIASLPMMTGETPATLVKKNTPPEVVSIKLDPKLIYPGTKIKAVIEGKDEDGDPVTFSREWKKNDELLAGETMDELDTKGLKKGDWITLYVTPFDGKEKGKRKWSPTVMISNRPPEITSSPPAALSSGRYIYEVKAVDPDGDKLTFSLENAPPGMTIDHVKGRIEWKLPKAEDPKTSGSHSIKVVVSDGNAIAFQGFSLTPKIEVVPPSP